MLVSKFFVRIYCLLFSVCIGYAQHIHKISAVLNTEEKTLCVFQETTYRNTSSDTLHEIILQDWINAYADRDSQLGKRFSDEYVRSFHLASTKERGKTSELHFIDENKYILRYKRLPNQEDVISLKLNTPLAPSQSITYSYNYVIKLPSSKFTGIGYDEENGYVLKNCFITPTMYTNEGFVKDSNLNLDDMSNALADYQITLELPNNLSIISDISDAQKKENRYFFEGKNKLNYSFYISEKNNFSVYKNQHVEVVSNLQSTRVDEISKAIVIDKVIGFVNEKLNTTTPSRIVVSQYDYSINPFYGLNQLPALLNPFPNDFIFEMKFLKIYLNNYLKNSLQIPQRKNNWIYDAIQYYYMMDYIDLYYPNAKMMGSIAKRKLVKGYHLVSLDFNEQYSYFYMLMARKNLDQPLNSSKDELIRFNEKIASKYRAGLSFRYLNDYLGSNTLDTSIQEFVKNSSHTICSAENFKTILKKNTTQNVDWFFDIIINSRKAIDYKFHKVNKTPHEVSFELKNKTNVFTPIPVYGLKNDSIVFKHWISEFKKDSIYTFPRNNAEKIVINYKNIVPEYNQRNNWKSLKGFFLTNRPIKFNFMKDLEDPNYNQILYVPEFGYNLYDGIIASLRFHNKTILDKPFTIDVSPSYSTNTQSLTGSFSFSINQNNRDSKLFNIRYGVSGTYLHYAQDAAYTRFNPYVAMRFRTDNFRLNHFKSLVMRQVYVNREPSQLVKNTLEGSYTVFDARFSNSFSEMAKALGYSTDLQLGGNFGKLIVESWYRKWIGSYRQLNLRLYAGTYLYNNTNTNFFDFALDRPSDYLFDYSYFGRSENSGFWSQQYLTAEGGFKSKITDKFANQWITAGNASISIWNWIEAYGDVGLLKNNGFSPKFVYDSGIRLNLVPDYFELYLPISSTNGWEIAQPHYAEKIRFVIAFSPKSLLGLFTRKWF